MHVLVGISMCILVRAKLLDIGSATAVVGPDDVCLPHTVFDLLSIQGSILDCTSHPPPSLVTYTLPLTCLLHARSISVCYVYLNKYNCFP